MSLLVPVFLGDTPITEYSWLQCLAAIPVDARKRGQSLKGVQFDPAVESRPLWHGCAADPMIDAEA
jgi:hypothetical protein